MSCHLPNAAPSLLQGIRQQPCVQAKLLDLLEKTARTSQWIAQSPFGIDLEVCMHDNELRARLLQLSAQGAATVLEDGRTSVRCENTAAAFVKLYLEQSAERAASKEPLMKLVRWHHLTATYFTHSDIDASALRAASSFLALPLDYHSQAARYAGTEDWGFFTAPARPASVLSGVTIEWEVPASELAHAFAKAKRGESTGISLCSPSYWYGGYSWYLVCKWIASDQRQQCTLGTFLHTPSKSSSAIPALVGAKYSILEGSRVAVDLSDGRVWRSGWGWGTGDFFKRAFGEWPEAGVPGVADAKKPLVLKCEIEEVL
jgi:hypothetical protein